MSTTMLLYKKITALSRDNHKNLKLSPAPDMGFAANTHWLPVAGVEFYAAAHHYPILFVSEGVGEGEQITPIALVGLKPGHNDHVDAQRAWKTGTYVPAFVRRYPFVLATTPEQRSQAGSDFTVCFDAGYAGLNDKDGRTLFEADGKNSPLLEEVLQFMGGFNAEMERTKAFVAELKKLQLLDKRSAQIRANDGAIFQVQDFLAVNEEKFQALTGAQLESLHKQGFLGWIFAHLMSMANLPGLLALHREGAGKEAKPEAIQKEAN